MRDLNAPTLQQATQPSRNGPSKTNISSTSVPTNWKVQTLESTLHIKSMS